MFKPKKLHRILPENLPLSKKIQLKINKIISNNTLCTHIELQRKLEIELKELLMDVKITYNDKNNTYDVVLKPIETAKFIKINVISTNSLEDI